MLFNPFLEFKPMRILLVHIFFPPVSIFKDCEFGQNPVLRIFKSMDFLFYGLVMLGLIVLVVIADSRVRFAMGVLWALSFWGFLHMAGGNIRISPAQP